MLILFAALALTASSSPAEARPPGPFLEDLAPRAWRLEDFPDPAPYALELPAPELLAGTGTIDLAPAPAVAPPSSSAPERQAARTEAAAGAAGTVARALERNPAP
jgi:hypothetical protein